MGDGPIDEDPRAKSYPQLTRRQRDHVDSDASDSRLEETVEGKRDHLPLRLRLLLEDTKALQLSRLLPPGVDSDEIQPLFWFIDEGIHESEDRIDLTDRWVRPRDDEVKMAREWGKLLGDLTDQLLGQESDASWDEISAALTWGFFEGACKQRMSGWSVPGAPKQLLDSVLPYLKEYRDEKVDQIEDYAENIGAHQRKRQAREKAVEEVTPKVNRILSDIGWESIQPEPVWEKEPIRPKNQEQDESGRLRMDLSDWMSRPVAHEILCLLAGEEMVDESDSYPTSPHDIPTETRYFQRPDGDWTFFDREVDAEEIRWASRRLSRSEVERILDKFQIRGRRLLRYQLVNAFYELQGTRRQGAEGLTFVRELVDVQAEDRGMVFSKESKSSNAISRGMRGTEELTSSVTKLGKALRGEDWAALPAVQGDRDAWELTPFGFALGKLYVSAANPRGRPRGPGLEDVVHDLVCSEKFDSTATL
jgi:hypothetical protein